MVLKSFTYHSLTTLELTGDRVIFTLQIMIFYSGRRSHTSTVWTRLIFTDTLMIGLFFSNHFLIASVRTLDCFVFAVALKMDAQRFTVLSRPRAPAFAVARTIDALTSKRPPRQRLSIRQGSEMAKENNVLLARRTLRGHGMPFLETRSAEYVGLAARDDRVPCDRHADRTHHVRQHRLDTWIHHFHSDGCIFIHIGQFRVCHSIQQSESETQKRMMKHTQWIAKEMCDLFVQMSFIDDLVGGRSSIRVQLVDVNRSCHHVPSLAVLLSVLFISLVQFSSVHQRCDTLHHCFDGDDMLSDVQNGGRNVVLPHRFPEAGVSQPSFQPETSLWSPKQQRSTALCGPQTQT